MSDEMRVLACGVLLLFGQIALQGATGLRDRGIAWGAGARDQAPPLGPVAGRAERALRNLGETLPVALALLLALEVTGRGGGIGAAGAWTWLAGRVAYVPLYVGGVAWWRSAAYGVAMFGIILMTARLLGA